MKSLGTGVPTPKVRVLVGDDEQVLVDTLATILDLAGYEVCAVYGGETVYRFLDLFRPDLVITDITAPAATGVEVRWKAFSTLPRCKILLFVGQANLLDLLRTEGAVNLPFEVVTYPILSKDLMVKMKRSICSACPPLVVPIDTEEAQVH